MGEVARAKTIPGLLEERLERQPDAPFVKCGGDWLSAADLHERGERLAAGLAARGVAAGDRVASIMPNREEAVELFFACARLGAVQVPLNYFLKGSFLEHQLADSDAKVLVADGPGYESARPLLARTAVELLVALDELSDSAPPATAIGWDALPAAGEAPPFELGQHDPVSIIYTSGTTGLPKGCVLPHGYYATVGAAFAEPGVLIEGDRLFTAFPLFHAGGRLNSIMTTLYSGGSVCFEQQFSASTFMARARAVQATMLWGVGPMGAAILATHPAADDARGFRLASWVPMSPDHQAAFEKRFKTPVVCEMYGQTECTPITISSLDGDRRRGSLGRPLSHLEVRVVDELDREVAPGEVGEVIVRSREPDRTFLGYWNNPGATVAAWRNLWHHTGDHARADKDGFLWFVDRKSDSLRRRGENISSVQLELAIAAHPAVAAAAVTAVPSALGEDDVKVSIVLSAEADAPSPEELFAFFSEQLPYFAIPRYVDLRDSLPTNAMSRVMKHVLREEGVREDMWDFEALGLRVAREERRGGRAPGADDA